MRSPTSATGEVDDARQTAGNLAALHRPKKGRSHDPASRAQAVCRTIDRPPLTLAGLA